MKAAIRSAQEPAPSEGRGALDKLPDLATEGATLRQSAQEPAPSEGRGALDKLPDLATEGATLRTSAHSAGAVDAAHIDVANGEKPAGIESWGISPPADHK